jgi:RNA polymerase sigma factor (sigma-70 family)
LKDRDAAEDAFQATFLALVRGAGSVRKRDSVASWLHGAALRVSACARASGARRRSHERRWAAGRATSGDAPQGDDLGAVLHEEVGRLPANYRAAVLLCDLEGLSHDEAARHLGLPIGTVKSRVARGRERLRSKLARRGFAPSAGAIGLTLAREAGAAVRPSLAASAVKLAIGFAGGRGTAGMILSPVEWLARLDYRRLMMRRLRALAAGLATVSVLSAGVSVLAQQGRGTASPAPARRQPQEAPKPRTIAKTYAVADLLGMSAQATTQRPQVNMGPLIQLISSTVAPGTWTIMNADGMPVEGAELDNHMGSIIPFILSGSLIIRHSAEVHAQVEERLGQIRRLMAVHEENQAKVIVAINPPDALPPSPAMLAGSSPDAAPVALAPPAPPSSDSFAVPRPLPTPRAEGTPAPAGSSDVLPAPQPTLAPRDEAAPSLDPSDPPAPPTPAGSSDNRSSRIPTPTPRAEAAPTVDSSDLRPSDPPPARAAAVPPGSHPVPSPRPGAALPPPRFEPSLTPSPASRPRRGKAVTPPHDEDESRRAESTERRLRALEEKLDRILKALDMPRDKEPDDAPAEPGPSVS